MTGRMYTVTFKAVAVTVQQDFFEITPAAGVPVIIHGFMLSQSTETGDAAEEMLQLTTNRGVGSTSSGSGGTTPSPAGQPIDDADAAIQCAVEVNNTTKMTAGSGSLEELEPHCWNIRVPYIFWYTPETRPRVKGSARWTLELETTPADSVTISGCVWIEEIC